MRQADDRSFRRRAWTDTWGGPAGIGLTLLAWQIGAAATNPVVLPTPGATLAALVRLVAEGDVFAAAWITTTHALGGFAAAALLGGLLGALAGANRFVRSLVWPLVSLLQGIPPIAWIVLALIWFGTGGSTATFTVAAANLPLLFVSTLEGVRSLDRALLETAHAFRVPRRVLVWDVYVPHLVSYLFPAVVTGLGMSWKVALMAELLAGADGIGDGLGVARVNLDTAAALAWIAVAVGLMLAVEYLALHPLKRRLEPWRSAEEPAPCSGRQLLLR